MKFSLLNAFLATCLLSAGLVAAVEQKFYFHNEKTGATQWDKPTIEHQDDKGNTYYVDPATGEATWEVPELAAWETHMSEEHGVEYYYNTVSEEVVWEKPEYLAWKVVNVKDEL